MCLLNNKILFSHQHKARPFVGHHIAIDELNFGLVKNFYWCCLCNNLHVLFIQKMPLLSISGEKMTSVCSSLFTVTVGMGGYDYITILACQGFKII